MPIIPPSRFPPSERLVKTCTWFRPTQIFNKWDHHEIATNGRRRVFFWAWSQEEAAGRPKDAGFQFYSPALAAKDFKQKVGDFTQTIFLPESTQAATGRDLQRDTNNSRANANGYRAHV